MDLTYRRSYHPRYDDADMYNRLTPVTLLNCCQDMASHHAGRLGVSVGALHALGLTWVLSRFRLQLQRYPSPGEVIEAATWPSTREGLFTCREFTLASADGEIWGRGTSSWAAIDLKSRRPVVIADRLPLYPLHPERTVDDPFATLPRLERTDRQMELPVTRRDLDMNRHVNNAVYLSWALEAVPDELYEASRPLDIALNFRAEALAGESIRSRVQLDAAATGCRSLHCIESADGRELARIVAEWGRGPCLSLQH